MIGVPPSEVANEDNRIHACSALKQCLAQSKHTATVMLRLQPLYKQICIEYTYVYILHICTHVHGVFYPHPSLSCTYFWSILFTAIIPNWKKKANQYHVSETSFNRRVPRHFTGARNFINKVNEEVVPWGPVGC